MAIKWTSDNNKRLDIFNAIETFTHRKRRNSTTKLYRYSSFHYFWSFMLHHVEIYCLEHTLKVFVDNLQYKQDKK